MSKPGYFCTFCYDVVMTNTLCLSARVGGRMSATVGGWLMKEERHGENKLQTSIRPFLDLSFTFSANLAAYIQENVCPPIKSDSVPPLPSPAVSLNRIRRHVRKMVTIQLSLHPLR